MPIEVTVISRKQQQAELIFEFGQLYGPILALARNRSAHTAEEQIRIPARFFAEVNKFRQKMGQFCNGEKGHSYSVQENKVFMMLHQIHQLMQHRTEDEAFNAVIRNAPLILDIIQSIPVAVDSSIHEASTPFSTYCFVKDLCNTVKSQLVWMDRYFEESVFYRYLRNVPDSVLITLVTLPASSLKSKGDHARYNAFLDISRDFAQERGQKGYRLVEDDQFHDRWLRCDNTFFALGGSIKDLDKPFTISRLDSTPATQREFEEPIKRGKELFGPNVATHP